MMLSWYGCHGQLNVHYLRVIGQATRHDGDDRKGTKRLKITGPRKLNLCTGIRKMSLVIQGGCLGGRNRFGAMTTKLT